jgi:hypothetical protein
LLSSNNRSGSFYWTRESKLGVLTSFSYFSCYFLIVDFLRSSSLLISLWLSWLYGNQILFPIFSFLGQSEVVRSTCAPMFLTQLAMFLSERDVVLGPWYLVRMSVGQPRIIHFFFTKPWAHTFLHDISFKSVQYILGKESSKDFQIRASGLIVACLMTAPGGFPKRSLHLILFQ